MSHESFINTLWEQYDAVISQTRKQVEASEESLLTALEEAGKKLSDQRGSIQSLVPDTTLFSPLKKSFDLLEKTEGIVEENQQALVKLHRESRTAWWNLQDECATAAREGQQAFFRSVEDSFRPFLGMNR